MASPELNELKPLDHKRSEHYVNTYANNIYFESSIWDFKLIFGQLDQQLGPNVITQNAAVTLPWTQVKLLFHYLRVHLAGYEAEHGKIKIPKNMMSEISPDAPPNVEPHIWEAVYKAYKQTLTENPGTVVAPAKQS